MPQVNDAKSLHPTAMKRAQFVICQRWPYACLNVENPPRSIRPEADPRLRPLREVEEAVSRSRQLLDELKLQMPNRAVKNSPPRRLSSRELTYKKQPRTMLNSAVRI